MQDLYAIIFPTAWVGFGVGVGMIFFAFINSLSITYENIGKFDPAGLSPPLRLSLTIVVAITLCALLRANVVELTVAGLRFNDFMANSIAAFALGMFAASTDVVATRLISNTFDSVAQRSSGR